jgi:hypothetical protein
MRIGLFLAAALTAGVAASGPARAARALTFDCKVEANQPDHGLTRWRRRIIVEAPPARQVSIQDDFGQGFVQRAAYRWVSVDARRIVLEEGGGKLSYIDRASGEYVLRNQARRFMIRGRCRPGGDELR